MTIASNLAFNSTILLQPKTAATAAKQAQPAPAPVVPMSRSLWQHTLNEDAKHHHHSIAARATYFVIGSLGLGSVGYALWQTYTLMAGSHLHDAVAAFMH